MRSESITWVGGEDDFALTLPLLDALQSRCGGDGVGLIFHRLSSGLFGTQDVVATLALGLEGGGMKKQDAVVKVRNLYEDYGLNPLAIPACAVLALALNGWPKEDEESGEDGAETRKPS